MKFSLRQYIHSAVLVFLVIDTVQASSILIVDGGIAAACTNYSIETRSCQNGAASAHPSPAEALEIAQAGDKVLLRDGSYAPIEVRVSGKAGQPVEISAFEGEHVLIQEPSIVV